MRPHHLAAMPLDTAASSPTPPIVLSFAASDPTGGAGIQADIMTLSALGCHPLSVITAITVQDTAGVDGMLPIDADWIDDQARTLLEDVPVAAFKLGVLGSLENIAVIASIVADYPDIPLILDPVLASGRGDQLVDEDMVDAMLQLLLPQTTILTPNSLEARRLAQDPDDETEEGESGQAGEAEMTLADCARRLIAAGSELVLITGTHEHTHPGQVSNTLYGRHGIVRSDKWARLPGSYHGSGCTLASAIAANLAHDMDIVEAVRGAQEYTWRTLAAGFRPGMGQSLPDRFFWARGNETSEAGEPDDAT
ncbi:Phosphomethylpyrimidine kinase [Sterolibacterium denitrificans]|uniref:hydroxymethylpyrimidine kinase n=2 Tax=Sterolibacterium denitrificans TaxID=157592 RepID=A0A7Z7HQ72_9PROT|nr:Phosphomethylpyrimidine kinase [Sterolibacterium denitrificans]